MGLRPVSQLRNRHLIPTTLRESLPADQLAILAQLVVLAPIEHRDPWCGREASRYRLTIADQDGSSQTYTAWDCQTSCPSAEAPCTDYPLLGSLHRLRNFPPAG